MVLSKESLQLQALRGATTTDCNSTEAIEASVKELVNELVKRNKLEPKQIVSITFSATKDLDACFPASIARQQEGWQNVALIDCQQMHVKSDLKRCIRILAHVWLATNQKPQHTYLREAISLRPDRSRNP